MKGFFSKRWLIVALVAVLLCLTMGILGTLSGGRVSPISNFINIIITPVQKGFAFVGDGIGNAVAHFSDYDRLTSENEDLRSKLAEKDKELRAAEKATKENEQLRAALDMKKRGQNFDVESSEIIARGNDNLSTTFTLDKGSLSGIAVDNCVITVDGMVGYVSEVGTNWSIVTAVCDTAMEASAIVTRTRDVASAEGDFDLMKQGRFKLSYLERGAQLVRGDTVETSGVGGLFPRGIVLGTVEDVKTETHGITKYAVVKPAVDLARVNHVLVIKSFTVTE
ncbi:MAG: rod shape-determining protein MreC [Clostridia bacterium]